MEINLGIYKEYDRVGKLRKMGQKSRETFAQTISFQCLGFKLRGGGKSESMG